MRESEIENYLVAQVETAGGLTRKLSWIGRTGAPDRVVILNTVVFVELKAPGKVLAPHQEREHRRLTRAGALVLTIDNKADVDLLIKVMLRD